MQWAYLVNAICQPSQLDSAYGSCIAVVIFDAYKQQTTVDS
jgi:hypothetical protein